MVDIIPRAQWLARAPRSTSTANWSARDAFVQHYSAGPTNQTVRQIQDFHMDTNGWSDIGYNFLVTADGRAWEGRGWNRVGAHTADHNGHTIGVCFIGRAGDDTPAARATLRWLYEEACRRAGRILLQRGHRDYNPTTCPGDTLYPWVRAGMDPNDGGTTMAEDTETVLDMAWRMDAIAAGTEVVRGGQRTGEPMELVRLVNKLILDLVAVRADVATLLARPPATVVLTPEDRAAIIAGISAQLRTIVDEESVSPGEIAAGSGA